MENQPKLNNSKEVIAYLAKRFPLCFIAEGEARPLKIGIFQDLVERLQTDNEKAISKTQLRSALRLYTSGWRYLHGVKNNTQRVDLEGNICGELTAEHIEHAQQKLVATKKKAQAQRAARQKTAEESGSPEKRRSVSRVEGKKPTHSGEMTKASSVSGKKTVQRNRRKTESARVAEKTTTSTPSDNQAPKKLKAESADLSKLQVGQDIRVKAGRCTMDATILEIAKDGIHVQLSSGLAMIVRAEHLHF